MPISLRTHFFEAFKSFTGLKFFWRWSGPIPEDKPDNVMLAPSFPQLDMLDHPKIKAFITQGGRPSIQEALCSNVPIISIPIFADQDHNAMKLERIEALVRLDINTITENDIAKAIQQVLYNPKYSEKMGELSRMFKDRPVDPLKNLVYWTEYALRHDTSLLKPLAMEQTWYQRRLLDVYGFLLVVFLTMILFIEIVVGSNPRIEEIIPSKMCVFCASFYESPEIQEWIVRPDLHFDLIFIDASLGECGYGLVHMFQAKHVLFFPAIPPYMFDAFGIVPESSIIEEKLNITNLPPLVEFERNSSLVFVNHHFVEEYPVSLPPLFVPYSGLGCSKNTKVKPLPEKLANFIQDTDGFIYVSFGSAVIASAMPKSMRDTFFEAFEAFPNLKFFWRWTGTVPENTPKNVLLHDWFPQQDILAHPKIKGFITQGGRPSTQEALCHGVQMIMIPIMGDQDYNADRLEYLGAAQTLQIDTISASHIRGALEKLLHNPELAKKMKQISEMFRDRPIDPLENAVYWTQYVLKYDTSLLKPLGMNQTWYERRLLDVYGFFIIGFIDTDYINSSFNIFYSQIHVAHFISK
ncbi:UDP-glucuronosyltransferase [Orchesella cincta]|uniref:UDP-glucuronosyltransferase n=1 Tax=Orchesella cincta TaxID=48709 RepID=A0A1D2N600_ORCCI|nr:UDP-glucuronosyltransferase [Orchesella cincta]